MREAQPKRGVARNNRELRIILTEARRAEM